MQKVQKEGMSVALRSRDEKLVSGTSIYVVDTLGLCFFSVFFCFFHFLILSVCLFVYFFFFAACFFCVQSTTIWEPRTSLIIMFIIIFLIGKYFYFFLSFFVPIEIRPSSSPSLYPIPTHNHWIRSQWPYSCL